MGTYRMDLSYDGTRYSGWQRLGDDPETVQQKIETALSRLLDTATQIDGSGRTDAGVHALGQVASFSTAKPVVPERLAAQLNHYLPGDIVVLGIAQAEERFHARFAAKKKKYCYRLWNAQLPSPFHRRYRHHVPEPLALKTMAMTGKMLCGTHDFSGFTTMKSKKKSAVRTIESVEITLNGPEIDITLVGDGFLHNMVRIIAGTLLEVGAGRMTPAQVEAVLKSGIRADAGPMAPANGLVLMGVDYGSGFPSGPEDWKGLSSR